MIVAKHPMRTAKLWARVRGKIEPFIAFAPVEQNPINTVRVEYELEEDSILVCFISDESTIDVNDIEAVQKLYRCLSLTLKCLISHHITGLKIICTRHMGTLSPWAFVRCCSTHA